MTFVSGCTSTYCFIQSKIVCTLTLLLPQCSIIGMISKRLNSLSGYSVLYFSSSFRYLDFSLLFGQFKIKQNTVVLYCFSASPWQTILNAEQHFLNKVTLSLLAGSYDVADIALHHNALNDIPFFGNLLML